MLVIFHQDSGSPLSTFSSTPDTTPNSATSPVTPTFEELAGAQIMDNEAEPVKLNTETTSKDEKLVKYLIGGISDSEEENQCTNLVACINIEEKENMNPKANLHETNWHEINLHETNTVAVLMVAVNANVIVKTGNESEKNNIQNTSKIKAKVTGRCDHNLTKQQEICKWYIKKGKDLTKLKTHLAKQTNKEIDFSMPKTKQTKTIAEVKAKEEAEKGWKTKDTGKRLRTTKPSRLIIKGTATDKGTD